MNIKKIFLLILITSVVYTCFIFYSFRDRSEIKINVVEVNDIAQSLAEEWDNLKTSKLPGLEYGLDYVVMNQNNDLIVATRNGLNNTINSAISNRDTIVDIKKENQILGKLIIYNNTDGIMKQYRKDMLTYSVLLMIFLAMLSFVYAVYIDRSIYRPFRKLQDFARHVAAGILDKPLEMDKSNRFGAFTESFDLMRDELNRARENERRANQSKKELVASLSHDIKTPIASIKAVTEVMYIKTKEENDKKRLDVINSKADQINTLITNLFNATLEELQELKVEVTEQSSLVLKEIIQYADYDNKVTISNIPECIILVDNLRLAQVIDNVISNSYKYAGTSMDVSFQITEEYLEVVFKDYGLGVLDEERPLLFNKFYRAQNSVNKSGAGLGLYISKYLMNKMSGEIGCENKEDGFVVRLKLRIE